MSVQNLLRNTLMASGCSGDSSGITGISAISQKHPVQIGWSRLPPSNSIQTLAPTGGTDRNPSSSAA